MGNYKEGLGHASTQIGEVLSWVLSVNSEPETEKLCLVFSNPLWGTGQSSGSGRWPLSIPPLISSLWCICPVSCTELDKEGWDAEENNPSGPI